MFAMAQVLIEIYCANWLHQNEILIFDFMKTMLNFSGCEISYVQ